MKNCPRFFKADGKGKSLKLTSKFLRSVLFTFASQSIHNLQRTGSVLFERAAKIRMYEFLTNNFEKKNVNNQ